MLLTILSYSVSPLSLTNNLSNATGFLEALPPRVWVEQQGGSPQSGSVHCTYIERGAWCKIEGHRDNWGCLHTGSRTTALGLCSPGKNWWSLQYETGKGAMKVMIRISGRARHFGYRGASQCSAIGCRCPERQDESPFGTGNPSGWVSVDVVHRERFLRLP